MAGADEVVAAVAELADRFDLGTRRQFLLGQAIGQASVYLALFAPPSGWVPVPDPKKDVLTWQLQGTSRVFTDVLSVRGPSAPVWVSGMKRLSRRILLEGQKSCGDRFEGVRVVALAAPGRSLLVTSVTAPPEALSESSLWFGAPIVATDALLAQAAGGGR